MLVFRKGKVLIPPTEARYPLEMMKSFCKGGVDKFLHEYNYEADTAATKWNTFGSIADLIIDSDFEECIPGEFEYFFPNLSQGWQTLVRCSTLWGGLLEGGPSISMPFLSKAKDGSTERMVLHIYMTSKKMPQAIVYSFENEPLALSAEDGHCILFPIPPPED